MEHPVQYTTADIDRSLLYIPHKNSSWIKSVERKLHVDDQGGVRRILRMGGDVFFYILKKN